MRTLIKVISLVLIVSFALVAISCNTDTESETLTSDTLGDEITEKNTNKSTKKNNKKEEATSRPIKQTEPPTTLENTDGLDLNLKILTQNVRYADDPNGNSVKERTTRFGALLEEYSPDIVGTQEVTYEWYQYLKTLDKYELVGSSKSGQEDENGDWNLIMYDAERFVLMDSETFWLSATPEIVSKIDGPSVIRICTWAELFDRYTGETIIMVNTHIDHTNTNYRVQQLHHLFAHLNDKLAERYDECRIYMTGDFNAVEDSRPHMLMENFEFVDSRSVAREDKSTVNVTCHEYFEGEEQWVFDYCFFKGEDTVLSYEIISKNYAGEMDTEPGFVSDHYGVIAVFERKGNS